MNSICQLFVYGSLRKGFEHPAFTYIATYFDFVCHAKIMGKLYDLGEYPAAVPGSENNFITGELYTIRHRDEFAYAIAQLDDYEGVNPGDDEEPLYRRELANIYTDNGLVMAWVYWYNGSVAGYPPIESGDVLEYMKQRL
jgi:gamma-glutamylcyclotransferase (GGCT)/AIG2-like uncharacterized protein YtfP